VGRWYIKGGTWVNYKTKQGQWPKKKEGVEEAGVGGRKIKSVAGEASMAEKKSGHLLHQQTNFNSDLEKGGGGKKRNAVNRGRKRARFQGTIAKLPRGKMSTIKREKNHGKKKHSWGTAFKTQQECGKKDRATTLTEERKKKKGRGGDALSENTTFTKLMGHFVLDLQKRQNSGEFKSRRRERESEPLADHGKS